MPRNPAPREHEPDDVEPWPWTEALVEADSAQDSDKDSDGHVDPEDPVPVEPVDHSSPENRSASDGRARDPAPHPDRHRSLVRREGFADQRQGQRQDDCSPASLDDAGYKERSDGGRQRSRRGPCCEDPDTDAEHPLPPETVAQGRPREQEAREGQM